MQVLHVTAQTRIVTNDDKEEKPHMCTQCNYSANQANFLNKHFLRHTGEKPYHCNQNLTGAQHMSISALGTLI